ncbi:hypothetical protein [Cellulomonas sp. Marseille-Q8402]
MRRALAVAAATAGLLLGLAPAASAASDTDPGGDAMELTVTVPDRSGLPFTVSDASLRWSLNTETGSGAYFGGCNFLMAGVPGTDGDAGSARVWSAADGLYRAVQDDVRVEKPGADGTYAPATWANRCQDRDGRTVTTGNGLSTETQVVLEGGTGRVDPATGTATVRWTGTFSVVMYGGMTYWWASDPVLTVAADGSARLTATAGGFGTSMTDQSRWERLDPTTIVLAELTGVDVGADERGFAGTPRYRGVTVSVPAGGTAQVRDGADWGAFPQSFVDFQTRTGQAGYWYSTGGAADARKPATPLYVSYDADQALVPADERPAATGTGTASLTAAGNRVVPRATTAAGAGVLAAADGLPAVPAVTALTVGRDLPSLVPAATAAGTGGDRAAWGLTGLLLAGSGTVIGFRRGWLVLPWR